MCARSITLVYAALFTAMLGAVPAGAQRSVDGNWAAYYGCWRPGTPEPGALANDAAASTGSGGSAGTESSPLRCVVPGRSADRVLMLTVARGAVVDRQEVIADGDAHVVEKDGCRSTETATWTGMGARLLVRGEMRCASGPSGVTSSILDVMTGSSWVQVSGVRAGGNIDARAQWYRQVAADSSWPPEVRTALAGTHTASGLARVSAVADPDAREVTRMANNSDEAVMRGWLVARAAAGRRVLPVSAAMLLAMERDGVSGAVTDVLVALANPQAFVMANGAAEPTVPTGRGGGDMRPRRNGNAWYDDQSCYAPWHASSWAFYNPMYGGFFPSGYGDCMGMPFGYGRQWAYGMSYGYGYPGWGLSGYPGGGYFWRPIGGLAPVPRATLTKGGGYSPAGGGGSGRVATGSGSSTGTTSNATSGKASGGSSTPSSGGGRTAVKKP